jgi:hypothetical protein
VDMDCPIQLEILKAGSWLIVGRRIWYEERGNFFTKDVICVHVLFYLLMELMCDSTRFFLIASEVYGGGSLHKLTNIPPPPSRSNKRLQISPRKF